MFMKVDLPEPDEPMTATNSPAATGQAHAAQRVDDDVAHGVVLREPVDLDERHGAP